MAAQPAPQLQDLRISLDNIDNALVYLLAERFRVTHKVGIFKRDHGLPAKDEAREAAQFARIESMAGAAGLDPEIARAVLRLIIDHVYKEHDTLASS